MLDTERQKRIYWHLVGIYNFSPKATEPYFSKTSCECCKSTFGGERYEFTGIVGKAHDGELVEITCCVDCFMYLFG